MSKASLRFLCEVLLSDTCTKSISDNINAAISRLAIVRANRTVLTELIAEVVVDLAAQSQSKLDAFLSSLLLVRKKKAADDNGKALTCHVMLCRSYFTPLLSSSSCYSSYSFTFLAFTFYSLFSFLVHFVTLSHTLTSTLSLALLDTFDIAPFLTHTSLTLTLTISPTCSTSPTLIFNYHILLLLHLHLLFLLLLHLFPCNRIGTALSSSTGSLYRPSANELPLGEAGGRYHERFLRAMETLDSVAAKTKR